MNIGKSDKLIFLYDELMTKEYQEVLRLPLKLVSLGLINAKLYFYNDTKIRRKFIIPNEKQSSSIVFGGLFLLKDYNEYKFHIHSFYNNEAMLETSFIEDFYVLSRVQVTPIKAKTYEDLLRSNIEYLDRLECEAFIGNLNNKKILHSITHRHYKMGAMDTQNFKQLLKER